MRSIDSTAQIIRIELPGSLTEIILPFIRSAASVAVSSWSRLIADKSFSHSGAGMRPRSFAQSREILTRPGGIPGGRPLQLGFQALYKIARDAGPQGLGKDDLSQELPAQVRGSF